MKNIAEILSKIKTISTDSRTAGQGDLFIAIVGEKFDGHNFVADVIARGAEFAIVSKPIDNVPTDKQIIVPDTKKAYLEIGEYMRNKLSELKVIALTGSAGKTTTKEMLKHVLSKFANVYATHANFNNDIGVAKTLCEIPSDAQIAIVEIGMSHTGEIANIVPHVRPDVAIVTNIYPMHLENFADISGIANAKAEIFAGLKQGGTAIINADTDCADVLISAAPSNTILYGEKDLINVSELENQTNVVANIDSKEIEFTLPMIGNHNVYNALCVLSAVNSLGFDTEIAAAALAEFSALPGRGKVHHLSLPNGGKWTLIDESYSAQPESLKLAIKNLDRMQAKRKVAVIGKMAEIGDQSEQMHREIGQLIAKTNIDLVVGVCSETKDILNQLPESIKQYYFENTDGLENFLLNELLNDGDVVLIKGSHYGSKLFAVVEKLLK